VPHEDDEVDAIIDAWSDILPTADLSPLDSLSRLRRVMHRVNRLRARAFREVGLTTWEFDVLAALRRVPAPHELSPVQLSTATMIGTAAMSNRLESLVARGLVSRRGNPVDGRSRLVVLSDEGARLVEQAMSALVAAEAEMLRPLSSAQQAALVDALRALGPEA
jgi:DNA-binding MarR family transcriptional regulator